MPKQSISLETYEKLKQQLQQRAQSPPPLTVRTLLRAIQPSVKQLLKRDHRLEPIASLLAEHGIVLDEAVLGRFYQRRARRSKGKKEPKKSVLVTPDKATLAADREVLTQEVTKAQYDAVCAAVKEATTQAKGHSLKDLVALLYDHIEQDLARGWTWYDIWSWFHLDNEIACSEDSLRTTFRKVKAERAKAAEGEEATVTPVEPSPVLKQATQFEPPAVPQQGPEARVTESVEPSDEPTLLPAPGDDFEDIIAQEFSGT